MIDDIRVIPECNIDTLLVRMLGFGWTRHEFGASRVAQCMQEPYYRNKIAIGVIDKIRELPLYFDDFSEVKSNEWLIHKHKVNTMHHLIYLRGGAEKFVLDSANVVRINPMDGRYKLPNSVKTLTRITKPASIKNNEKFKAFLNDVVQRNAEPTKILKSWIEEILATDSR